jgi:hypothetical protein
MPDWTFFAPLLAALVAAFLSGYAVNRWKGRQEHLEERFDELCSIISDTATLSSEYWQGSQQEDGMSLREAKIMAALRKIAGLRVLLADYGSRSAAAEIELA